MKNHKIHRMCLTTLINYIASNPIDSMVSNRHMNRFKDGETTHELITVEHGEVKLKADKLELNNVLSDFFSRLDWDKLNGDKKSDLLTFLTDALKAEYGDIKDEMYHIHADLILAVLVDFINYVGISMWVDYGLYTKDIA